MHSFILLIKQLGPLRACENRTGPWFKRSANLDSKVILIPICGVIHGPCALMPYISNVTEFTTCKPHCLKHFISQEEGAAATLHHTASVGNVFFHACFPLYHISAFALADTDQQTTESLITCFFLNETQWVTVHKKVSKYLNSWVMRPPSDLITSSV